MRRDWRKVDLGEGGDQRDEPHPNFDGCAWGIHVRRRPDKLGHGKNLSMNELLNLVVHYRVMALLLVIVLGFVLFLAGAAGAANVPETRPPGSTDPTRSASFWERFNSDDAFARYALVSLCGWALALAAILILAPHIPSCTKACPPGTEIQPADPW